MHGDNLLKNYSVLFLEESRTLQELFETWLSEVPTHFASTPDDIPAQFDSTVAVACLDESLLGEEEADIRKQILKWNPYCQLVLLLPQSSFVTPYEDHYDACLQRPIFQEDLQDTIEEKLLAGVYSAELREFYSLNAKVHWLRRSDSAVESDRDVSQEDLVNRYRQSQSRLKQLQSHLDTATIESISQSIDLHKRYLTEPAEEAEQTLASKYHPNRCPACKLTWGADHGNELGKGLVSIGADVWKCTRCGEIVHGLGESGRQVTGR